MKKTLTLLLAILLLICGGCKKPETPPEQTTLPTEKPVESVESVPTTPSLPEDLPPVVELPVETDPATGEKKPLSFPATVEGYDLVIEKLAPYNGLFVEDGSNREVQGVAMLLLNNKGSFPVEYGEITVEYENTTLTFAITALPVGEKAVVQEKHGLPVPQGAPKSCKAMVIRRGALSLTQDKLEITDNGDDSFTVTNLTEKTIPGVRVFYKYYMKDEGLFVGGIAFTVKLPSLEPNAPMTVRPAHYTSDSVKVVMALTYEEG